VLSLVYGREKHKARAVTASKYFLKNVSQTFHGRDVFAPVAAHLARGVRPAQFGKLIQDHLRTSFEKVVRTGKRYWSGAVLKADRFGNLITNFRLEEFPELRVRPFQLTAGLLPVTRLASTYAEGAPGELLLVDGSAGYLEVTLNQGSAAQMLKIGPGSPLELMIL
jgi:S-adenosylmethionine hydrolase